MQYLHISIINKQEEFFSWPKSLNSGTVSYCSWCAAVRQRSSFSTRPLHGGLAATQTDLKLQYRHKADDAGITLALK